MSEDEVFPLTAFERQSRREALARRRGLEYPSIAPFEVRALKSSIGGLERSRKRLERQLKTPENIEKLRVIEEKLKDRRRELGLVSPPKPPKQRLWAFTRYWKYIPSDPKSRDMRNIEVSVCIPFLADWTGWQVGRYERDVISLCETALNNAIKRKSRDPNAWEKISNDIGNDLETGWTTVPEKFARECVGGPTSKGWEMATDTEPLSLTESVSTEAEIVNKSSATWKLLDPYSTERVIWRIPEWAR